MTSVEAAAGIRAITVREPWSSLIAAGVKTVENRAQGTTHRGPVLIHTSLTPADPAVMGNPHIRRALADIAYEPNPGAVIAIADLVDVHLAEDVPTLDGSDGTCCQPWGQRWHGTRIIRTARHLVLANVRRLPEPFETRGALSVWTPPEHVTYLVNEQMATAGAR